jgi:protein-L-isoaspartate(D-aspartate) O-methyltransferase
MMLLHVALAVACLGVLVACTCSQPPVPQDSAAPGTSGQPRSDERRLERHDMVRTQIAARGVRDPLVLEAVRNVPRHWFVPPGVAFDAYADGPLPIGSGQTISQPYIVALMTEALRLQPGEKVLEIGTGSGYQAAVLSEITPHVFTIEIVPELAATARAAFDRHGYATIATRQGDGYRGWPEEAPFDAIVVTAAPDHVPPALIEQLATGGRLCIPVGESTATQYLLVLTKRDDGTTARDVLAPVRFVPMTGEARER